MAHVAFATDNGLVTAFSGFPCQLAHFAYDFTIERKKAVELFWKIESWDITINNDGGLIGTGGPYEFFACQTNTDNPADNPLLDSEIGLIQNPGGMWTNGTSDFRYFFIAFSDQPGDDISIRAVLLVNGLQGQVLAVSYDGTTFTFTDGSYNYTVAPASEWDYAD